MLIDKGYYDYDYQEPKPKPKKLTEEQKRIWSKEEVAQVLGRAIDPATGKSIFQPRKITPEEAQRIAMEEIKKQKDRRK